MGEIKSLIGTLSTATVIISIPIFAGILISNGGNDVKESVENSPKVIVTGHDYVEEGSNIDETSHVIEEFLVKHPSCGQGRIYASQDKKVLTKTNNACYSDLGTDIEQTLGGEIPSVLVDINDELIFGIGKEILDTDFSLEYDQNFVEVYDSWDAYQEIEKTEKENSS